jgi:hypothetical protein
MLVSERGTLGEFNIGQSLVARTMRPVLQALVPLHRGFDRLILSCGELREGATVDEQCDAARHTGLACDKSGLLE